MEQPVDADLIVVNTCSFIVPAVRESIETVLELADLREEGRRLVVAGCMVARYGRKTLRSLLPEVDIFLHPDDYGRLTAILGEGTGKGIREKPTRRRDFSSTLSRGFVYLKVSEGCNRRCTFCTIPRLRGRMRSLPWPEIVSEARYFLRRGARELVLVAQDLTAYGKDLYGRPSLPLLLEKLSGLEGDYRLRLLYLHPDGVTRGLLEAMDHPRVYPYFDLPFQHVDPDILRSMGRRGGYLEFGRLVERIRSRFPDAALRATFMVGFPGEDRRRFLSLFRFVKETRFDWLGLFLYSQEEGTRAYALGKGCAAGVAEGRLRLLAELQDEIMHQKALSMVGRELRVLVEGPSEEAPGYLEARSYREAPEVDGVIFLRRAEWVRPASWCRVRVESAEGMDLIAIAQNRRLATPDRTGGG